VTPGRRSARVALLAGGALALLGVVPAAAQSPATVTLTIGATAITFGDALPVSGTVSHNGAPLAGAAVELELDRYPYRGFAVVAGTRSASDGSFSFAGVRPSRNSRLRVIAPATGARSATAAVIVNPAVRLDSRSVARGRTLLSATAVHTRAYGSPPVDAYWYVAALHSTRFQLVAVTRTSESPAGVTTMQATVNPPARRFSFVVCFVPAWARAMGPPSARLPCRDHDFVARPSSEADR